MSWWSYLLLGDFGQQLDIHDLKARISAESHRNYETDAEQSEQIAELRLLVESLIRVLVKKGLITPAELAEQVKDGKADQPDRSDQSTAEG